MDGNGWILRECIELSYGQSCPPPRPSCAARHIKNRAPDRPIPSKTSINGLESPSGPPRFLALKPFVASHPKTLDALPKQKRLLDSSALGVFSSHLSTVSDEIDGDVSSCSCGLRPGLGDYGGGARPCRRGLQFLPLLLAAAVGCGGWPSSGRCCKGGN